MTTMKGVLSRLLCGPPRQGLCPRGARDRHLVVACRRITATDQSEIMGVPPRATGSIWPTETSDALLPTARSSSTGATRTTSRSCSSRRDRCRPRRLPPLAHQRRTIPADPGTATCGRSSTGWRCNHVRIGWQAGSSGSPSTSRSRCGIDRCRHRSGGPWCPVGVGGRAGRGRWGSPCRRGRVELLPRRQDLAVEPGRFPRRCAGLLTRVSCRPRTDTVPIGRASPSAPASRGPASPLRERPSERRGWDLSAWSALPRSEPAVER
jgi:hypothetical protein